jgi:hypothetical protein
VQGGEFLLTRLSTEVAPRRVRALVVVVGEHDGCRWLLLETVEYLAVRCSGVTRYVIFHAAAWNAMAWVARREAMVHSGAKPILKLVGSEPIPLNPPS